MPVPNEQTETAMPLLPPVARSLLWVQPEIEALLGNGSTQKFIAKRYGTTAGNLHNWLKKRGIKRAKG